jgi:hypothetical protein
MRLASPLRLSPATAPDPIAPAATDPGSTIAAVGRDGRVTIDNGSEARYSRAMIHSIACQGRKLFFLDFGERDEPMPKVYDLAAGSMPSRPATGTVEAGEAAWLADTQNNRIFRVDAHGRIVRTLGGHDSGSIRFRQIHDVAVMPGTSLLLVLEQGDGHRIIRVIAEDGRNRTIDLPSSLPAFGLAVDFQRGIIYLSDAINHTIHTMAADRSLDGSVEQVLAAQWEAPERVFGQAGVPGNQDSSSGQEPTFNRPMGLALSDHCLYVADTVNHRIRKVDMFQRTVTTLATHSADPAGAATGSGLVIPTGLAVSSDNTVLYVLHQDDRNIARVSTDGGEVENLVVARPSRDLAPAAAPATAAPDLTVATVAAPAAAAQTEPPAEQQA